MPVTTTFMRCREVVEVFEVPTAENELAWLAAPAWAQALMESNPTPGHLIINNAGIISKMAPAAFHKHYERGTEMTTPKIEEGATLPRAESPATAPEPANRPPLLALLDYADLADDHSYGTLSAKLVRDLVNEALATPSPTGATVPGVLTTSAARDQ